MRQLLSCHFQLRVPIRVWTSGINGDVRLGVVADQCRDRAGLRLCDDIPHCEVYAAQCHDGDAVATVRYRLVVEAVPELCDVISVVESCANQEFPVVSVHDWQRCQAASAIAVSDMSGVGLDAYDDLPQLVAPIVGSECGVARIHGGYVCDFHGWSKC